MCENLDARDQSGNITTHIKGYEAELSVKQDITVAEAQEIEERV